MKALSLIPRFLLTLLAVALPTARAATVFTDTLIGVNEMTYEGQDLVVSNAVLTVDGSHTFNSLRLTAGAVLTHTPTWDGPLWRLNHMTNELHQFSDTNAARLVYGTILQDSITVTDTNGLVTYTNQVDYVITNLGSFFELRRTTNSFIPDGTFVFVGYDYQTVEDAGLDLAIATDFDVEPGASVNADHRGWTSASGQQGGSSGSPLSGGGGGHGGSGGVSSSNAAGGNTGGSAFRPLGFGVAGGVGSGGYGGTGGGGIEIQVGGNCFLNGSLTANGQNATNSRAGGGAGGSIWITAQTISGNGGLHANGGAGEPIHGGGGGGGRIALIATTNLFSGNLSAFGGAGWQRGGAGTMFVQDDVAGPKLIIDNGGQSGAATPVNLSTSGAALVVQGRAHVVSPSYLHEQSMTNLVVRAGSTISTTATNMATLNWFVSGDAVIEAGATVQLGGRGYPPNQGLGTGGSSGTVGSGAGHGGYGGSGLSGATVSPGGNTYGSISRPTIIGSGGRSIGVFPGGTGGGAVRLSIGGKLQLDGEIVADGTTGSGTSSGGASGGSVWLTLGEFSGSGLISANGGNGGMPLGGGGGGGRIAVTCDSNTFTGTMTAYGGAGARAGGAGTIYVKRSFSSVPDLRVDNGGLVGTNTLLNLAGMYNLSIIGGAICLATDPPTGLGSVMVGPNSTWLLGSSSSSANLTVASNLTVALGGRISGDGLTRLGPGAGSTSAAGSTGGGHGGYGGRGAGFTNTLTAPGGNVYDSTATPSQSGSGGGSTFSGGVGGAGGGALRLSVSGTLILDGHISANGNDGATNNSGGGSGGALWLSLNRFSGSGSASADGGNGFLPNGGGGGGGRIAVYWNSNSFTGKYSAKGGNGFVPGGAGTIYLKANSAPTPSLILDNGGLLGTNTVLDVSPLLNLTISSGARVVPGSNFSAGTLRITNLYIGDAATLYVTNTGLWIGSANVAAGGAILADGVSASGPGRGVTSGTSTTAGSSGAGHGGYGGRGAATAAGGNAYELTAAPGAGSPGGGFGSTFGLGGGVLSLNVSGLLVLDGRISANGSDAGTNGSGGGSGGTLILNFNRLSGSGIISADGGSGHLPNGGGGAGGRISIICASNSFTGSVSAKGGPGFAAGGAGIIILWRQSIGVLPIVTVDNGGVPGTNTPLFGFSSLLALNVRSGASVTSSLQSLTVSNLNIEANAALQVGSMQLTVGSAYIAAGGAITADGVSSSGSGAGQSFTTGSGGGGHGGYGGRGAGTSFGGNAYDPTANPNQSGSPGGGLIQTGGRGGGSLRMTVSGPLVLDGRITANGSSVNTNNSGGGSGGTIALTLNQFSGAGLICADGGNGHLPNGGGGSGGRIAVSWNSNLFTGKYSAKGGNGFQAGGAGTIYLKRNNAQLPSLVVDNGGLSGTNTVLDVFSLSNLTVAGGAVLRPISSSLISLSSLNIATNATLLGPPNNGLLSLSLSGPTVVEEGGSISVEGLGPAGGSGAGGAAREGGGGGGHGGFGGRANSPAVTGGAGGIAFDTLATPTQPGGRGGGIIDLGPFGGSGGGAIRITAMGPFLLGGRISANGLHSVSNSGGGGAGGSVSLDFTRSPLLGSGTITADGGNGHLPNGGGGGGGRIAVRYDYAVSGNQSSNGFFGTFSAKGGNGFMNGGAGTIYIRTNNSNIAQVIVDNGGARGTNTSVSRSGSYDLTVQGGAVAVELGDLRDVWVRSNAWLSTYLQSTTINIQRDAIIEPGGGIDLDGLGRSFQLGGSSLTTPKGGGGYGGHGGFQFLNSGLAYGSATSPIHLGSPGGNGSGSASSGPYGGAGGGLAQLVVGRSLQLDGEISADGRDGEFNSGGGSGGGVRLQALTFAGNGRLTANGGNGNGTAGGGGGGRIAIYFTTNLFTGTISACGGNGGEAGGAGTIFFRDNLRSVSSLLLDNCGLAGASTPFSAAIGLATNLVVSGGTRAEAEGVIPIFSNLVVTTGGSVTTRSTDSNLFLALLGNLTVAADSGIVVDGRGFTLTNGPGAGGSLANQGAGGGHGGAGGSSASEATGGTAYGSPTRPVDRGSGGGAGLGSPSSGSEGGGAIRLSVAGTLALDGLISSSGAMGLQDDSGGGAGGSVWITAGKFTGRGSLEAIGGDGELYGGGGGGGGRIALYSPMNTFTGLVSVAGGNGAFVGETGTVFTSGSLGGLEVLVQTPNGVVSNVVSEVLLEFSEPLNLLSVTPDDVILHTPDGPLSQSNLTLSLPAPGTLRITFPAQNVTGNYRLEVGPEITDLFALPMSQVYTGAFRVALPAISGTVTDTNGQPVAGVLLQPSGFDLLPALTDANGNYSLGVPSGWSGTVTPAMGEFAFVPGRRSYSNISNDVINQNFQMVASLAPSLQVTGGGTNLLLTWNAYAGVAYQVFASTNLTDWVPFDSPLVGTNGLIQLVLPITDEPQKFFRVTAQN